MSLLKLSSVIRTENFISRRDAEFAEKNGLFVTSIMRLPDPAHTSCPCRAEVNFTRRVCGFAGMNYSPIPAKKHAFSAFSVDSNDRKGVGERKKAVTNDVGGVMKDLGS
jgi:hypothetical protein